MAMGSKTGFARSEGQLPGSARSERVRLGPASSDCSVHPLSTTHPVPYIYTYIYFLLILGSASEPHPSICPEGGAYRDVLREIWLLELDHDQRGVRYSAHQVSLSWKWLNIRVFINRERLRKA